MLKKRQFFSAVHSKTGLWALAFLYFHFLILVPSRLRNVALMWNHYRVDLFEPWSGFLPIYCQGLDILFLG